MDWNTFYLAICGAAATLMGLLFVAIQFNIDIFASDVSNRWRAVARSTFDNFVVIFLLSLFFLVPGVESQVQGVIVILIAIISGVRVAVNWLPVWRGVFQGSRERLLQLAWRLVGPLIGYAVIANFGWQLLQGHQSVLDQQYFAYAMLGLFAVVLRNSWNLLVEVTYERKHAATR